MIFILFKVLHQSLMLFFGVEPKILVLVLHFIESVDEVLILLLVFALHRSNHGAIIGIKTRLIVKSDVALVS